MEIEVNSNEMEEEKDQVLENYDYESSGTGSKDWRGEKDVESWD